MFFLSCVSCWERADRILDLYLSISNDIVSTKIYDKRDNFDFEIVKDQESIQSSTTLDTRYKWKSDKLTVRHHKREPRGQPFPSR